MSANPGHIIIKKGRSSQQDKMSKFYRQIDKGSSKPAFCYPRRAENLKEEHASMQRNLERGLVSPERKMIYEQKAKQLGERVKEIDASFENAKKIIKSDKDGWKARRDELGKIILDQTPTRDDERKRKVNPHSVLRREKVGENGKDPLEKIKKEYTIISRAFQAAGDYEEANHSFLQRDK